MCSPHGLVWTMKEKRSGYHKATAERFFGVASECIRDFSNQFSAEVVVDFFFTDSDQDILQISTRCCKVDIAAIIP